MVDIAMCSRRDCEDKNTCFRYLAFPSEYQSYIIVDIHEPTKKNCSHYWRCRDAKELRQMNRMNRDFEGD